MNKEAIYSKNIWEEKLNIGICIYEIGLKKRIKLVFDKKGRFMIIGPVDNYYPSEQGEISKWDYETELIIKKDNGDWPKYAAEDMLYEIEQQIYPKPRLYIA